MNEAALGVHANADRPAAARAEPPEPVRVGVSLSTLLAVTRLTPPQAAQLVADLVDELEAAGARRGRPVTVREDVVSVSDDGRLTIDGVVARIELNDAVVDVIRAVATNCRGSGFGDILTESISGATDLGDLVRRARRVVDPELDPAHETRRRRSIGDLVSMTRSRSLPEVPTVAVRTGASSMRSEPLLPTGSLVPTSGWFPPVRSAWHSRRRRPSRRQGVFALLAIVVLVGAAVAAPRAWEQLSRGWNALLDPVNPSAQNLIDPVSPPPEPADAAGAGTGGVQPAPVDTGAPAAAGRIAGVTASFADGSCSPGKPCAVRVDVRLDPSATVDAVTWKLNVYDRCSGEVREGGDVTMPAEPGRDGVYGLSRTTLPAGSALAVAAVTSAPAVAASEPLYVPAEQAACL